MSKSKNIIVNITNQEKLAVFFSTMFTGFIGGFIIGHHYRKNGEEEKANKLKPYMYLGILMSFILFIVIISFLGDTTPKEHKDIRNILPQIEDYTSDVEFSNPNNLN